MPAGEGVAAGQWDGSVRTAKANAWVPDGLSVWELSVNSRPGVKADDDYGKRFETPDGSAVDRCTYVQLILRPWTDRSNWAKSRRAEKRWRDIRAYGLDDVEAWLETAPVTWAWFSEELGLNPYGMRTAETWWDAWVRQTSPAMTPGLVLAGRNAAVKAIEARVVGPTITTVEGASVDETCAVLAAMAVSADAEGDGRMLARLAFVNDLSTWRLLLDSAQSLVLVPLDPAFAHEVPSGSPHAVLVPVSGTGVADVDLPPLDAAGVTAALKAAGMSDDKKADESGRLARRSLTALRRNLATNIALHRPQWAERPVPRHIRAVLLAGSWTDQCDGDQSVLAELSGDPYGAFREMAAALANEADPFILQVGASWHLVSAFDAWLLLVERLTEDDLKRLESVVVAVIGEEDPALEVPEEERWWKASLEGKVRAFSSDLRRGLARSLALLGVHGASIGLSGGSSGADWANYLVRSLLKKANEDLTGRRWASLSDLLPLLAEAGPDAFIDAVTAGTSGDTPLLAKMFTDKEHDGMFSSSSPHTGLLWALEGLAWSPNHFGAAVDLLARLDELDPGGRLANRPFASLAGVFCPWHPKNSATPDRRLKVIDGLRKRHGDAAWKLLLSMLPEFHGTHFPTHEPECRDWTPAKVPVTNVEYMSFVSAVVERCIEDAGTEGVRWKSLLAHYSDLPPNDRTMVVDALSHLVEPGTLSQGDSNLLWNALRDLLSRHREFSDAKWALTEESLVGLDKLVEKLKPSRAYERHEWLFQDHMPHLEDTTRRENHAAYEALLAERRRDAVGEIESEGGLNALRRLSAAAEVSWSVGIALAEACPNYDDDLLESLDSADGVELAGQYYFQRFRQEGWEWFGALIGRHPDATALQRARLLLASRDLPRAWEVAEGLGADVAEHYWKNFIPYGLGGDFDRVEFVADRLMKVGRYAMALDFIGMYMRGEGKDEQRLAELIGEGLDGLLTITDDSEFRALSGYDFETLFAFLEQHRETLGIDRVARLEWGFLFALGYDPEVPALHEGMSDNPEFFVEVICAVYRSRRAEEPETPEADVDQQEVRARHGYHLLSSWNRPPGLADAHLDSDRLHAWLDEAKRLLDERGRLEVGLVHFGHVLASAPADPNGDWPPEVVRDLLEELHSADVESGLSTEILNRRGVTSRGLEEGGGQEEELAAKYRADADRFADDSPRTAALLRNIAKSYETDARRNEDSAERFRRGL
jgi:hypothetical protein